MVIDIWGLIHAGRGRRAPLMSQMVAVAVRVLGVFAVRSGLASSAIGLAHLYSRQGQPSFKAIVVAGPTSRCVFLGNIF